MQTETSISRRGVLLLTAILTTFFIIRLGLFVGIVGADDFSIAAQSLSVLSDGLYLPFDHYSSRIGLIYPQALIFMLFGVGEWQMAAIPLAASLGGVFLAYAIGRHYGGEGAGLLAAFLLAIFPLDAYFSTQLMPDLPLGVMIGLAFYLLIRSEATGSIFLAIIAGLVWGWAYLIKVEAFFFVFVVLALLLTRQLSWRTVLICGVSVGAIVLGEHVIYYLASGDPLLRLHLATVQGGGKTTEAYSFGQLWVFPKHWFLTPYYFGLHYYLLFFTLVWFSLSRRWALFPLLVWVTIFLLWLQFGGNPFSANYSIKSHLPRYCNMINIPMAVLLAILVFDFSKKWGRMAAGAVLIPAVAIALLFIPFNKLSAERQMATKDLLDIVKSEQLFPLYLDRVSLTIAHLYLYEDAQKGRLHTLQKHDFKKMETQTPDLNDISGYVLINRGFVEFGYNRYRVKSIKPSDFSERFEVHSVSNNPMSEVSYLSARALKWLAGFIPSERFRVKIQGTADDLLRGEDAVLMKQQT